MKTPKASRNKLFAFSSFFIVLVLFVGVCPMNQAIASSANGNVTTQEITADHQLLIFDFSHQYKPIYENYSKVEFTFQFISSEADNARLHVYFTKDFINWTVVEFTEKEKLSDNNYLFKGSLGTFATEGTYYLEVNATEVFIQYDALYTKLEVIPVTGLIFVDFEYLVKEQTDSKQYIDFFVSVIGDDLNISKVRLTTDQHTEDDELIVMNASNESVVRFLATVGPTTDWAEIVHITFIANTTTDVVYISNDFYILIEPVSAPEDFLRSKLPAILVSVIVMGSIFTIFIMAKRKPPRKFDKFEENK